MAMIRYKGGKGWKQVPWTGVLLRLFSKGVEVELGVRKQKILE